MAKVQKTREEWAAVQIMVVIAVPHTLPPLLPPLLLRLLLLFATTVEEAEVAHAAQLAEGAKLAKEAAEEHAAQMAEVFYRWRRRAALGLSVRRTFLAALRHRCRALLSRWHDTMAGHSTGWLSGPISCTRHVMSIAFAGAAQCHSPAAHMAAADAAWRAAAGTAGLHALSSLLLCRVSELKRLAMRHCPDAVTDVPNVQDPRSKDTKIDVDALDFSAFVRIDAWVRNLIASNPVG